MAGIDPSIALQARHFPINSPLQNAAPVISLLGLLQQQEAQRQQLAHQQTMQPLQMDLLRAQIAAAQEVPAQRQAAAAKSMLELQEKLKSQQAMEKLGSEMAKPSEADALAAVRQAEARGEPANITARNQNLVQSLMAQVAPQQAVSAMLRQQNVPIYSPAGPGSMAFNRQTGQFEGAQVPFAPRAEPAPTVRVVPDANNPGRFNYEDMRRPGTPLAQAPSPAGTGETKPPKDYRWNADRTAFELIPGSQTEFKMRAAEEKDTRAAKLSSSALQAELTNIEKLIGSENKRKLHPGLTSAVGPIDVRIPTVFTSTANADALIQSLQSKASISALQTIRGMSASIGQITEREWPRLESMKATLQQSQGTDQFVKSLEDYRKEIKRMISNINDGLDKSKQPRTIPADGGVESQPAPQAGSVIKFDSQGNPL